MHFIDDVGENNAFVKMQCLVSKKRQG
jgi:hypothetical protein